MNTSDFQQKNEFGVEDFQNEIKRDFDDEILFDVFIRGDQEARIILSEKSVIDLLEPMYEIGNGHSGGTNRIEKMTKHLSHLLSDWKQ